MGGNDSFGADAELASATYACCKNLAHFVAPSISSIWRRRWRYLSTDRYRECTVGVLSVLPPLLVLCDAPVAACSCFSTSAILFASSCSYAGCPPVICVRGSFSCSTIVSTSSSRCCMSSWRFSRLFVTFCHSPGYYF